MQELPESLKQLISQYNKATHNHQLVMSVTVHITEPSPKGSIYYTRGASNSYQDYSIPLDSNGVPKHVYKMTLVNNRNPSGGDILGAHMVVTFTSLWSIENYLNQMIDMLTELTTTLTV